MTVLDYLRQMVDMKSKMDFGNPPPPYLGMEDYLLKHGQEFTSQPLTDKELEIVAFASSLHECWERECFYNAQFLAQCCRRFTYCEGVAVSVIPTHHAWLSINGKVVDLTWRVEEKADRSLLPDRNLGTFNPPYAYFGIEIPNCDWFRWWKRHRNASVPILDDWENGWPLFQGKPLSEIIPIRKHRPSR